MRARSIRLRTGAPYDDRLGPVSGFSSSQSNNPLVFTRSTSVSGQCLRFQADGQTVLCLCLLGNLALNRLRVKANAQPLSSPISSSRRYTSDAESQADEEGQTGEESPGAVPGEAGVASVAWNVCVRPNHIFSNHIDALFFHRGHGSREPPAFSALLYAAA